MAIWNFPMKFKSNNQNMEIDGNIAGGEKKRRSTSRSDTDTQFGMGPSESIGRQKGFTSMAIIITIPPPEWSFEKSRPIYNARQDHIVSKRRQVPCRLIIFRSLSICVCVCVCQSGASSSSPNTRGKLFFSILFDFYETGCKWVSTPRWSLDSLKDLHFIFLPSPFDFKSSSVFKWKPGAERCTPSWGERIKILLLLLLFPPRLLLFH